MSDKWQPNPATKALPFLIGGFGWQIHGVMIGIGLGIVYLAIIIALNTKLMLNDDVETELAFKKIQRNKWVYFAVFMLGIGLSGIEAGSVG